MIGSLQDLQLLIQMNKKNFFDPVNHLVYMTPELQEYSNEHEEILIGLPSQ